MTFQILTFNINGRHKHFKNPPFRTFTSETVEFWKKFQQEMDRTRNVNGISRVKRANYEKLLFLMNGNDEVNSDMWLNVKRVDICILRASKVNPSSDVLCDKVISEAYVTIICSIFLIAIIVNCNNLIF